MLEQRHLSAGGDPIPRPAFFPITILSPTPVFRLSDGAIDTARKEEKQVVRNQAETGKKRPPGLLRSIPEYQGPDFSGIPEFKDFFFSLPLLNFFVLSLCCIPGISSYIRCFPASTADFSPPCFSFSSFSLFIVVFSALTLTRDRGMMALEAEERMNGSRANADPAFSAQYRVLP